MKVCEITGKVAIVGNNVSHSHHKTKRKFSPNLKQLNASMGRIAGSINQIAKRCNENKSVHANDVEQLRREFLELKADYLERVVKLLRKIY